MKSILFRMPAEAKARFERLCKERGLSMSDYLRLLVTDELKKQEE
jgi:antitoxin component of RelBE/YafQ-DinJ toxin-antitoxin module